MKNRFYILFSLPLWFGISQNALCMKEEENLSRTLISLIPQEDDKGKEEDNLPISSRLQGDCNECHQKDCGSCQRDLLLEERKILLNLQNELSKGGENNEQKKEELRVNSVRWLTKWQNLIRSSKEGNLRNIVGLSKAGLEQCCNLMETCTIYPSKRSEKLSEFIQTMKSSVKNPESKIFEWHLKKEFGEGDYGQEYFESLLKMYQTSYDDLNKELTPDIHKCQNQIKLIRKHIESKENDSANLELYRFCTELISLEKKARLESIEKLKKLLEFLKNKKIFISFEILRNSNIFSAKAAAVECLSSMIASISPAFTYNESKIKKEILSFSDGENSFLDFQWTLERELKYDLKGSLWMERLKDQSESQKSPKNKLESGALQDQEKGSWINELNAMRSMKKAQVFFLEDLEQEENVFESPVLERLSEKYSLNMYDLVDLLEKERNQIQNKPENLSEKFIQYKEKIIKAIHSFVSEVNKRAIKNQNKNKEKPIITWDTLKDSAYYRVCVDILSLFFEGLNESQELNLNEKKDFSLNQFEKELKKTLGNKIKTVILSKKEKRATLNNRMGVPQKTLQTVSSLEQPNQNQEIKFDKNPSNSESDDSEDKNTVLLHHVGNGFHDVYVPLSEDIKNAPITSSENVENSGKEEINEDLPIFEKIDFKKPYLNKKQQRKSTPKPVEKEKNLTFYSTMLSEYEKLKKCEKLLFSDYLKLLKDLLSCNKTFFNELEFKNIRGTHITFKLSQKNGKPITWEFSRVGGGRYIPQNFNYRQWYLKPFEILGISKENFHEYKK